jgi:hypothetical protein
MNYFSKGNLVDQVHGRWTTAGSRGPSWTDSGVDGRMPWRGGMLTGVWPPATPEHGSSPARAQKREGSAGNPSQASPELEQWCSGRAMTMMRLRREDSTAVVFELGGRGNVEWVGAERTGGGSPPFIGAGGWQGEAVARWQQSAWR